MQRGFCPHPTHWKFWNISHHFSCFNLIHSFRLILYFLGFWKPPQVSSSVLSPHSLPLASLYPGLLSLGVSSDMYKNIHNSYICKKKTPQMFISSILDKQIVVICGKTEGSTAIQMNKLLLHVASWMNLTNSASNRNWTQKSKSHMIWLT